MQCQKFWRGQTSCLLLFTILIGLLSSFARSEYSTILKDATVVCHPPQSSSEDWGPLALIDDSYKTVMVTDGTDPNSDGSAEFVITLSQSRTIATVFIQNTADAISSLRLGKTQVWVGTVSTPFSTSLKLCKDDIFDTGLYTMDAGCTGQYVVIRRKGPPQNQMSDLIYNIAEVRLFEVFNVLELESGAEILFTETSVDGFAPINLIENFNSMRSSGNNLKRIIDENGSRDTSETCFKTEVAAGQKFEFHIKFGWPTLVSSVIITQDLESAPVSNLEVYVHHEKVTKATDPLSRCSGAVGDTSASHNGGAVSVWSYGSEFWCNRAGAFIFVKADLGNVAPVEVSICNLGILGWTFPKGHAAVTKDKLQLEELPTISMVNGAVVPLLNINSYRPIQTTIPGLSSLNSKIVAMPYFPIGIKVWPAEVSIDWISKTFDGKWTDKILFQPVSAQGCAWILKICFVDESLPEKPELIFEVIEIQVGAWVRNTPIPTLAVERDAWNTLTPFKFQVEDLHRENACPAMSQEMSMKFGNEKVNFSDNLNNGIDSATVFTIKDQIGSTEITIDPTVITSNYCQWTQKFFSYYLWTDGTTKIVVNSEVVKFTLIISSPVWAYHENKPPPLCKDFKNGQGRKGFGNFKYTQDPMPCFKETMRKASGGPSYISFWGREVSQWFFFPSMMTPTANGQLCDEDFTIENLQGKTIIKSDTIKIRMQPDSYTRTTPLPTIIYIEYGQIYTLHVEKVIWSPPTCYTPDFQLTQVELQELAWASIAPAGSDFTITLNPGNTQPCDYKLKLNIKDESSCEKKVMHTEEVKVFYIEQDFIRLTVPLSTFTQTLVASTSSQFGITSYNVAQGILTCRRYRYLKARQQVGTVLPFVTLTQGFTLQVNLSPTIPDTLACDYIVVLEWYDDLLPNLPVLYTDKIKVTVEVFEWTRQVAIPSRVELTSPYKITLVDVYDLMPSPLTCLKTDIMLRQKSGAELSFVTIQNQVDVAFVLINPEGVPLCDYTLELETYDDLEVTKVAVKTETISVGIYGEYRRNKEPIDILLIDWDKTSQTYTFEVDYIYSIIPRCVNEKIKIRQKSSIEFIPWVSIEQGVGKAVITATPNSITPCHFTLILESFDDLHAQKKIHLTDVIAIKILPDFNRMGEGPPTSILQVEWNVISSFFVQNIQPVTGLCNFKAAYMAYPDYSWIGFNQTSSPTAEVYFNVTQTPPGHYQFELRAYDSNDPIKFGLMNDTIYVYIHNPPLPPPPCPITTNQVSIVQEELTKLGPLALAVIQQKGVLPLTFTSYRDWLNFISQRLVYDDDMKQKCGEMVVTLAGKSYTTMMQLVTEFDQLLLFRDPEVDDGQYDKAHISVTINKTFELKIAVSASLESCKVNKVSFERSILFVTYPIGTGILSIPIPGVIQKPDCKLDGFSEVQLVGIETELSPENVNSALSLDAKKKVVIVQTDDLQFDGNVVNCIIGVKHKTKALSTNVQIIVTFEQESTKSESTDSSTLGKDLGIPNLVVAPLDAEAQSLLDTPVDDIAVDDLFKAIPLANRLTKGVDSVKDFAKKQIQQVTKKAAEVSQFQRPPEIRIQVTNFKKARIWFSEKVERREDIFADIQESFHEDRRRRLAKSLSSGRRRIQSFATRGEEADNDEEVEPIMQDWFVTAVDETGIDIELVFFNQLRVTKGDVPDMLFIQVELSELKGQLSGLNLPVSITKMIELPRQMKDEDEVEKVDITSTVAESSSSSLLSGNFIVNYALAREMGKVWGMINSLQIVQKLRLYDAKTPGNINSFANVMGDITSVQLIDTEALIQEYIYVPEQLPYTLNFQTAGFDSSLMLENAQSFLINFVLFFSLILILLMLKLVHSMIPKMKARVTKLQNTIFWNGMIRLFMEAYLDFVLFSLLNIVEMQWPDNIGSIAISNYISILILTLCFMTPVFLIVFSCVNKDRWDDDDYSNKYSSFLQGTKSTKQNDHNAAVFVKAMFFLRRLALCLTLVFWPTFFWGQVAMQFMLSKFMIILLQWFSPLESPTAKWMETFAEITNLFVLYLLMCFTDFVTDPEMRNTLGYSYIGVVCQYAAVNIIVILIDTCVSSKLSLKFCFVRLTHCCKKKEKKSKANVASQTAGDQPLDDIEEEESRLEISEEEHEQEEEEEKEKQIECVTEKSTSDSKLIQEVQLHIAAQSNQQQQQKDIEEQQARAVARQRCPPRRAQSSDKMIDASPPQNVVDQVEPIYSNQQEDQASSAKDQPAMSVFEEVERMRREDEEKEREKAKYDGWQWMSSESEAAAPSVAAADDGWLDISSESEAAADDHIVNDTIEEWMAEIPDRSDNHMEVKAKPIDEKPAIKIMIIR